VPALRSGAIVLADRYVYSLMARDLVRGADQQWLEALYGMAIQPDAVFYLQTAPAHLEERIFESHGSLDYWESGMDLGLSRDWHESFVKYQHRMRQAFKTLQKRFGFETLNGNRLPSTIQRDLRTRTTAILDPPPVPLTPERTADDVSLMPAEVRMQ
jgi:dTMP kinase